MAVAITEKAIITSKMFTSTDYNNFNDHKYEERPLRAAKYKHFAKVKSFDWYNCFINNDQFDDLKQFISATVSQATSSMASKDDVKHLEEQIVGVEHKIDELASSVAEALDTHSNVTDKQFEVHKPTH